MNMIKVKSWLKKAKPYLIILCIALLLELLVFNFHSYHLIFGGYEKTELTLNSANLNGGYIEKDGTYSSGSTGKTVSIEYKDIGKKVGSVYIKCTLPDSYTDEKGAAHPKTDYVNVSIDAKDETWASSYRGNVAKGQIINGNERSHIIILDLSGEVSDLNIKLTTETGSTFTVESVTINRSLPIHFSLLRILLITLITSFIYAMIKIPMFCENIENRKFATKTAFMVITAIFVLLAMRLTDITGNMTGYKNTSGNQITQEIVDAFRAGQVHLLKTPPKELLELDNPYDWSERIEKGVNGLWDHLLFEGKYYSYYGIAPVLLLYLPYNLITGYYFPTAESILNFGVVGIIFLSMLFYELIKRFFPKLSVNLAVFSLIILQLCSGIWYCFVYANFYEIAQSSGFMFTCMGFYFLIRSSVIGEGRINKLSLVASSFCLAMAVLCRPTLALYCVVALIFLAFGYIKMRTSVKENGGSLVKEGAKYLACALTCYAVIGGIQMMYNFMRFGNPLDFGIQYSLTINDFTRAQYHTDFAVIGFWNFLFAFPTVRPEFPFVFCNFSSLDVNGYYFIANYNAIGLIWRALPIFGYFGASSAYKKLEKKKRLPAILLIGSTCVLAPLIIIFSIWESGYGVRYSADFAWQLIVGAMCILFFLYSLTDKKENKADMRKMITVFFAISVIVALAVNFGMIYDYIPKTGVRESEYLSFERIFEFWK